MKITTSLAIWALLLSMEVSAQSGSLVKFQVYGPVNCRAGDTIRLEITIQVEPGWWVYAPVSINRLQQMQLTELRFDRLPVGVRSSGSMEIPNSHQRGSHAVYEGKNHRFRQTFVIDSSWTGQEVLFKAKLTYQACNERICYPPITEKFEYRIPVNSSGRTNSEPTPSAGGESISGKDSAWAAVKEAMTMFASEEKYQRYLTLSPWEMKSFEDRHALVKVKAAETFLDDYPEAMEHTEAEAIFMEADPYFLSLPGAGRSDTVQNRRDLDWKAFMRALPVDSAAAAAWLEKGDKMMKRVIKSNATLQDKENAAFLLFARDFRLASRIYSWMPVSEAEADYWLVVQRIYWQQFNNRFYEHVKTYGNLPIIAKRAGDFLTALKSFAPSAAAEGWDTLQSLTAKEGIDSKKEGYAALHSASTEQIDALKKEKGTIPLTMAFLAIDNRRIDMKELKGKVVLVDFWASWCKPCVEELPNVKHIYEKYHKQGFEVLGICLDDQSALPRVKKILQKEGIDWPQRFEGAGFQGDAYRLLYGINSLPAVWLVDQSGFIVSTDARGTKLDSMIRKLLEKKTGK